MPIKPENRARYPADWPRIRERIRARARDRCERCGVPNAVMVWRTFIGDTPVWGDPFKAGVFWSANDGSLIYDGIAFGVEDTEGRHVRIVCTVAHVHDPSPENCDDDNLAFWCQRCHNLHDQPMRIENARQTRRGRRAVGDLFTNQEQSDATA